MQAYGISKIWPLLVSSLLHSAILGVMVLPQMSGSVETRNGTTAPIAVTLVSEGNGQASAAPHAIATTPIAPTLEQLATPTADRSAAPGVVAASTSDAAPLASPAQGGGAVIGGAVGGATRASLLSQYQAEIVAHVLKYRLYPQAARREGLHGLATIRFAIDRAGEVSDAKLQQSSGVTLLDDAALATIQRAAPLPPVPAGLPDEIVILLPLDFIAPSSRIGSAS